MKKVGDTLTISTFLLHKMLQKAIANYYILFAEKLKNSTCIVLMVALLVLLVGAIVPIADANSSHLMKGSIIEATAGAQLDAVNVITIDGKQYELIFSEISR